MSSFFQKIVKLFSYDIGIDLGTATTLVMVQGQGVVIHEPSVVAIDRSTRKVLAIGAEADSSVADQLQSLTQTPVRRIGDCNDLGYIEGAMHSGHAAGLGI